MMNAVQNTAAVECGIAAFTFTYFPLENLPILHWLSSIIVISREFNIVDADAALRTGCTRPLVVWEALQRVGALQKQFLSLFEKR